MPISLSCPNCGRGYLLKTELAGRNIRCRDCSTVLQVPTQTSHDVEDYYDGDAATAHQKRATSRRPGDRGGRLPPRARPGSTASAVSTSRPRQKKRRKPSAKLPVKKILFGVVGLVILAVLVKFGLDVKDKIQQRLAATQPDWREYQVQGPPISIQMPGPPQPMNEFRNGFSIQGVMVVLGKYMWEFGGMYVVIYSDHQIVPGDIPNADTWFQHSHSELLQAMFPSGMGEIDESIISITDRGGNVHPGREYRIRGELDGKKMSMICRIYIVGEHMIAAFTAGPTRHDRALQPRYTTYFDSLQITDSVAPFEFGPKPAAGQVLENPGRPMSGF